MLLLLHVSLLVVVCACQLVHHGELVVHLLGVIGAYRLLALACTHSCSRRVRLL